MPSSCGRCGATPLWATTGRVSSADSKARFTHRSSTLLFHDGSCWLRTCLAAEAPMAALRSSSTGSGSLCAHQVMIDGWWPSRSTASRAWRTACLRIVRAYFHCSGKSCHTSMPSSSAASYSSGPADVAEHPDEVEPRLAGRLDVGADRRRRGLADGHPGGCQAGALHEHPLAVHREHPVLHGHLAQPGAHRAAVADDAVDLDLDDHLGQRLLAHRPRPPQLRVVDVDGPGDLVEPLGQRLLGGLDLDAVHEGAHQRGLLLGAVQLGPQAEVGAGVVDVAAQHPQAIEAHRAGGVHAHRPPHAAGFHDGSAQSQCWKTPVMLRFAVRSRWAAQATSTARTCSLPSLDSPVISNVCGKK